MFGKNFVSQLISRSAENPEDRRRFLKSAGAAGLGVLGAGALGAAAGPAASADADANAITDGAVLNFALNLEYLEAEFYSFAVYGHGLPDGFTWGKGHRGRVDGGREVSFASSGVQQMAMGIARDEYDHVRFLRGALGSAAVARPKINIRESFTAAATAAGLIHSGQTFDVYANENNFLLGAFIFEDVGVTAYKGAAPLISNKTYLGAAAGILAVEAYHAANIRTLLYERGLDQAANAISSARDSLDGKSDDDQGITLNGRANIVPTDGNGLVFGRTTAQVLNVVYLTPKKATSGGFFPRGVNGADQHQRLTREAGPRHLAGTAPLTGVRPGQAGQWSEDPRGPGRGVGVHGGRKPGQRAVLRSVHQAGRGQAAQPGAAQVAGPENRDGCRDVSLRRGPLAAGRSAVGGPGALQPPPARVGRQQFVSHLDHHVRGTGIAPLAECGRDVGEPDPEPVGQGGARPAPVSEHVQQRIIDRPLPGHHLANQVPGEQVGPQRRRGHSVGRNELADRQAAVTAGRRRPTQASSGTARTRAGPSRPRPAGTSASSFPSGRTPGR